MLLNVKLKLSKGSTSHQTHYRSYRGRVFTGSVTECTSATGLQLLTYLPLHTKAVSICKCRVVDAVACLMHLLCGSSKHTSTHLLSKELENDHKYNKDINDTMAKT